MMCREVDDLRHDLAVFLLNGLNTPWVLSRLRLMLNLVFVSLYLRLSRIFFKLMVTRVGQISGWSYQTTSDDRISTICLILPNEFLGISEESRGKPRNFHFLMHTICRLAGICHEMQ